jgi:methylmalonyl-CoA mutase N-terminal domain/subunit
MYQEDFLEKLRYSEKKWRERNRREIEEAEAKEVSCEDGIPLKLFYTPLDDQIDFFQDIGFPGEFPYTRGIDASGYRKNLWTLSQYAGFGSPKETNLLFKKMIEHGNVPYLALDLPTQNGYDPDHPMALGEVGRAGTPVSSLRDWETIFDGINLGDIYVGTVANAQAAVILAMHVVAAEKQGADLKKLRGSLQNDILKEFTARGNYIFPVEPSIRLAVDVIEYCAKNLPNYWPICVCGGHFSEAGANRIHEVAFSMANAFTYIDEVLKRELPIDRFAKGFFFLMKTNHYDFFEEVAKFRAMRKIWARTLKERYGAKDPDSMKLKILGHAGGSLMTKERAELNIARNTIACMAGALGGIQLIGLKTLDEVFGIPSEKAQLIAIGTQHVVAYETGIPDVVDPLGGSYYVETLTKEFENQVVNELDRIEKMGGVVKGIESGYFKRVIAEDAYKSHKDMELGRRVKVGVNKFRVEEEFTLKPYRVDPREEARRIEELKELKRNRDNSLVERVLKDLKEVAKKPSSSENNLVPPIIEAVKAYATMGEICGTLREVFGEYQEPPIL